MMARLCEDFTILIPPFLSLFQGTPLNLTLLPSANACDLYSAAGRFSSIK